MLLLYILIYSLGTAMFIYQANKPSGYFIYIGSVACLVILASLVLIVGKVHEQSLTALVSEVTESRNCILDANGVNNEHNVLLKKD